MSRCFVLSTGRSGTLTWAKACEHLDSHTVGHESHAGRITGRLDYDDDHIEIDNRLAWFTGLLEERYGDEPVYCHLTRDPELVARSYARRFHVTGGLAAAFTSGIIHQPLPGSDTGRLDAMRLMVATVTANISMFLRDKTHVVTVDIAAPHSGFDAMVGMLGATGDIDAAHRQLEVVTNASRR